MKFKTTFTHQVHKEKIGRLAHTQLPALYVGTGLAIV